MKIVPDEPLHTEAAGLDRVLATGRPTLVVFEAPGCKPCQSLGPVLDRLAREWAGRLLVVRVDARPGWLAARHHLSFVPTLAFWADGRERARIKGNPGEAAVRAHLDYLVEGLPCPEPASGARHALASSFVTKTPWDRPRGLLAVRSPGA